VADGGGGTLQSGVLAFTALRRRGSEHRRARQRGDALAVWLLYLSHWAADFITGSKPTWPGGPTVGLGLYGHPVWDCVVECAVIVVAWFAYRRSFGPAIRRRIGVALVPLGLIALQVGFELIQTPEIRAAVRELP